ncbi:tail fiber/spike domain-containing protein [Citrobacter freundii]
MATQPTNLPVPSESPRDLKFNAGKIDEFVTSMARQYIDRFGSAHYTIEGIRWVAQQAIAAFGYITLDSFEDGNTLTLPNQVLRLEANGEYYRWDGVFPKDVPAGSTPQTTGGVGVGAWLSVGDATARQWVAENFTETPFKKTGMFNSGVTVSSKNDAVQYTDGLWYVWTGPLPHTISSSETPDVETTKWACVGLLNGHEIFSALNYGNSWGIHDDSPLLRKAIISLIRTGYARFCINAGITINLFTECVIPFYLDGKAVSFRFHGETSIGSLSRVSELAVSLGIRGLVFEAPQVEIDHFTPRQWAGNAGQSIVSYTSDTVTLSFDPWPDGRTPVIWPFGTTAGDGTVYTSYLEFTTDAGGYYASGVTRNVDGTVTLTNVHPIGPTNTISSATIVNFFQSHAPNYPEGSFADTAAIITLAVSENPFIHNLWPLAAYRVFAHGLGSGAGPGSLMGNIGVWSDIIVDGAVYFISNTDVGPSSPQGINNGAFNNIQLSGVRRGIRARRAYNLAFNNVQHIASGSVSYDAVTISASEIEGVTVNGSQLGWTSIDWVTDT